MKRIILVLSVLLYVTGIGQNAEAQTFTGFNYNDSCFTGTTGGTTINSYATISGPAGTKSCLVEINHGDGSKMDTNIIFGTSAFYSQASHLYTVGGTYTVKMVIICSGVRVDSMSRSITVTCRYIWGLLYNDKNSNCIHNTGENGLTSQSQIQVDSAGIPVDTLFAYGYWAYIMRATTTTVYTFTILGNPIGFVKSCPSTGIITHTFNPLSTTIPAKDFAFNCSSTPVYDYKLFYGRALRGASSTGASFIRLYAANSSCSAGTGTVTLNVSPKYNITSSGIVPTPASVSGNTVTWTIPNMVDGINTYLYVPLTPKSTTSNGDTACNYAIITPTTGDADPMNNVINICDSVRASWDPNEKSVSPGGAVSAGALLTYTIDFENLGNDTAFNIHVQDTLSSYLDASSFVLIGATHSVTPYLYETPGGVRIIKFDFAGINLEDKTVPTRNKGQVRFSMKLKSGLAPGTVIANRAGIYFDGNPVVLTNYSYNQIPFPQTVPPLSPRNAVKVFPNPAQDALHIRVDNGTWKEAILHNTVGQTISGISLHPGNNVLNIQSLPAGIYYLQVRGGDGVITEKIEKQ